MKLFHALLTQAPGAAPTYVAFPTPPVFTDTNTITPSGNQTINLAALVGKSEQLIAAGQASAFTLNDIVGTSAVPIRFKSQTPANRAIIGDGTVPAQRCVRTLNTVNFFELHNMILYSNQGGVGITGGGSEAAATGMYISDVESHLHTFAGIWCNTGNGHFAYVNTAFVRVFDLDGGAPDGTDGGEGYYLGNTSGASRSVFYESKHNHIYINKAAREGIQITSVWDLEMNNMTIRNSGTWGAPAGVGQNRMGQFQFTNGIVRDTIWDGAASSFEVFANDMTFYNNYFKWANTDRFYIGDGDLAELQLNGQPLIFDNCVFKSTAGSNPLLYVAMRNGNVIVRNCIISDNISSLFTDNRGSSPPNSLIDGGGNTYVPAASIPDPVYIIEPGFDLHLTYANTAAMTGDQGSQTNGRRYLADTTYYTKTTRSTGSLTDYIITEPAYVVSSAYHYNRNMGYRTPKASIQPTGITLSVSSFADGNAINDVIGTLTATGGSGSYTYSILTTGYRSDDDTAFNISGSSLRASVVFNAAVKDEYYVRVRATSNTNSMRYVDRWFLLTITTTPTVATDIVLTDNTVDEEVAIGTAVGVLTDNSYPSSTYTLVAGTGSTDNASFSIVGNELRIQVVPDYEVKTSYAIRIRATNTANGGLTYEEQFTVNINDIDDNAIDLHFNFGPPTSVSVAGLVDCFSASTGTPTTTTYTNVGGTGITFAFNDFDGSSNLGEYVTAYVDREAALTYFQLNSGGATTLISRTVTISGLQPSTGYDLIGFSSRNDAAARPTTWSCDGKSETINAGNGGNTTATADLINCVSNGSGQLVLTLSNDNGSGAATNAFAYMNTLRIVTH